MAETATVDGRDAAPSRPRERAVVRAWLVVGLAAWAAIGVELVDRANRQGLVADIGFSPYHLVGYAALVVLAAYALGAVFRGIRRGNWRGSFPRYYEGLGIGFACLVGWVVLDAVWRNAIGVGPGIEGALAPTRLLIPVGLVLVASGPLREVLEHPHGDVPIGRWQVGAAAVAAGLIGAVVSLQGFNPVRDPLSDLVASAPRDASEIWSMAADGSAQTRLLAVHDVGIDYSLPAWSPDGRQIAYTKWTNRGGSKSNVRFEDQTASIWLMGADGTGSKVLADGAPGQAWIPAWSADGQWISYTVNHAAGAAASAQPQPNAGPGGAIGPPSGTPGSEIWRIHPDGTGAQRLTDAAESALSATWASDRSWIAFIVPAGDGSDIHIAAVTGGGLADEQALAADPANDWGPAWSPDGSRIAFTSNRSGNEEIWTVGRDGQNLTRLTDDPAGDWVPAWSPDGKRIAFVSDRGNDVEIWSMAADGSDLRDLSNSGSTIDGQWSVAWSPDGSHLLYARSAYPAAESTPIVREDLAAAQALLFAAIVAVVALFLVALGAPLGGFTVALTIMVALAAVPSDQWRFLPAAIVAGAVTEVLVRGMRPSRRARVAATALPALAVLGIGVTLGLTGSLAWSVTLLLGVTVTAALVGLGIAEAVARLRPSGLRTTPLAPGGPQA